MAGFLAAAVHAAPAFMDKKASLQKVVDFIHQASDQRIKLLVFPEVFVPGYPSFITAYPPLQYLGAVSEYTKQSIAVFGPAIVKEDQWKVSEDLIPVLEACKEGGVSIVLGVSERYSFSAETLFSSQIFVSSAGAVLGVHRKLVPTFCERSVWAHGAGATLRCWDIALTRDDDGGSLRIGGLCCSENLHYGARLAYIQEGQQLHAASWPGLCSLKGLENSWERTKVLAQSHSYGGACFTLAASSIVSEDELNWNVKRFGSFGDLLTPGSGWSGIVDPSGRILNEEATGTQEKLVVARIDPNLIHPAKLMTDPRGHYARPEVFRFEVKREATWDDDEIVAGRRHSTADP